MTSWIEGTTTTKQRHARSCEQFNGLHITTATALRGDGASHASKARESANDLSEGMVHLPPAPNPLLPLLLVPNGVFPVAGTAPNAVVCG